VSRARGAALARALEQAGFRGQLVPDAPLAPLTTWRIGGPVATPRDADDVALALAWAAASGVPWRVLGNGSNLLVGDAGVPGVVLRLRRVLDEVRIDGARVAAGAGASFPALVHDVAARGLGGIEFGAGIPGTIGGAVIMNAGWHAHEIGAAVVHVTLLRPDGTLVDVPRERCGFAYRASAFRHAGVVVLGATLELVPTDPAAIAARLAEFAAVRKATQPTELPSCGSVFLKPPGDFAGRLIDAAGLKGLRIGDVQVSPKHANFFVNVGHATAADALALVERVEHEVRARFGVELVREFELW
jgi:UDP-N-acetylmuramate dehydrogenase